MYWKEEFVSFTYRPLDEIVVCEIWVAARRPADRLALIIERVAGWPSARPSAIYRRQSHHGPCVTRHLPACRSFARPSVSPARSRTSEPSRRHRRQPTPFRQELLDAVFNPVDIQIM